MTFQPPRSGLQNAAEYVQGTGLPWVSSSAVGNTPIRIDFPHVTNWVHIRNTGGGGNLRFGWSQNGINSAVTSNYGLLPVSTSFEAPLRMRSIFLRSDGVTSASYELVVGLTMILHKEFPILTGSGVPSGSADNASRDYGYGINGSEASGSGI